MKQHYHFMFLGYPGSGKSTFAKQLAQKTGAVRLNADAIRVSIFGTIQAAKDFDARTSDLNTVVFGALEYAATQILQSGQSVISDFQHNQRDFRASRAKQASASGAVPIVVWVKTPRDLAITRGSQRAEEHDVRRHSTEKITALIDKYNALLEEPSDDEHVIIIDGTQPFATQYESFQHQLTF